MTIVSPFAIGASGGVRTSLVITGIVIGIVAIIELAMYATQHVSYWPVINILAGIWLLVSTSMASATPGLAWSNVVLGVTAIISAVLALSYERTHATNRHTPTHA
jgi:hypothetical protein